LIEAEGAADPHRGLLRVLTRLYPQHHHLRHAMPQPGPLPLCVPPAGAHELLLAGRERLPFK